MRAGFVTYAVQGLLIVAVFAAIVLAARSLLERGPNAEVSVSMDTSGFPKLDVSDVGAKTEEGDGLETATFGSGCFWCTEAVFQRLNGVKSVASGYAGGHVENPSYYAVCSGTTGHAEVVQVKYDPSVVSFAELLEVFWRTHDPTTPNQQGNDVGPQYRSVVFYHNERQRELAEQYRAAIDEARVFKAPVVTEISPYTNYYEAEADHQNYYNLNSRQSYCQYVIQPKVEKLEKVFADKLK